MRTSAGTLSRDTQISKSHIIVQWFSVACVLCWLTRFYFVDYSGVYLQTVTCGVTPLEWRSAPRRAPNPPPPSGNGLVHVVIILGLYISPFWCDQWSDICKVKVTFKDLHFHSLLSVYQSIQSMSHYIFLGTGDNFKQNYNGICVNNKNDKNCNGNSCLGLSGLWTPDCHSDMQFLKLLPQNWKLI